MLFGQEQTRCIYVCARDVRMDVDSAGHRDETGCIDCLIGLGAIWRRDDALVVNPQIADRVAFVGGIDDAGAFDMDQHAPALGSGREAAMRPRASATLKLAAGAEAVMATKVPVSAEWRIAS